MWTTIRISTETQAWLLSLGGKGETYEELLVRLRKLVDGAKRPKRA